jgi:UDP-N-acetylglucosamine--N-acetylmuramyl-(pentapeptide) pyrophosphoryl-undecaprenol N-acetylglucosamine transferase
MRLLIAGGGTGGHIYPALAVARSLRARPDAPELAWLGGHRGLEAGIVRSAGLPFERLLVRSLRTVDRSVNVVVDPLRLSLSVPQAAAYLARRRPDAIFTTGGYVAIPVLLAAQPLRIPVLLWEGNVVPGRSVRTTAPLADVIAVSFAQTCAALGRLDGAATGGTLATGAALTQGATLAADGTLAAGAMRRGPDRARPCYVTGTPIRDTREIDREAARGRLDVPPGARLLLVFGGSQEVRRFNAAVAGALDRLVERVHLVHVTGEGGYAAALAQREELPGELRARYRPYPFLRDDMLSALAAADLVVGRAGSSTLAEVTALGLPMVVVPYPHAAGHQRANARVLVDAGAARLVEDDAFDAEALLGAAALLDDAAAHLRMSAASRALGRPASAEVVADLLLAVAARRPLPDPALVERRSRGLGA